VNVSVPGGTAVSYSSIAGAVTGIILWLLSHYAFRGNAVPEPIQTGAWILIPAAVTGLGAWLTRRHTATTAAPPTPAPAPPQPPRQPELPGGNVMIIPPTPVPGAPPRLPVYRRSCL
jgi:hypothetical protein